MGSKSFYKVFVGATFLDLSGTGLWRSIYNSKKWKESQIKEVFWLKQGWIREIRWRMTNF
jgi:hypothetical protein